MRIISYPRFTPSFETIERRIFYSLGKEERKEFEKIGRRKTAWISEIQQIEEYLFYDAMMRIGSLYQATERRVEDCLEIRPAILLGTNEAPTKLFKKYFWNKTKFSWEKAQVDEVNITLYEEFASFVKRNNFPELWWGRLNGDEEGIKLLCPVDTNEKKEYSVEHPAKEAYFRMNMPHLSADGHITPQAIALELIREKIRSIPRTLDIILTHPKR